MTQVQTVKKEINEYVSDSTGSPVMCCLLALTVKKTKTKCFTATPSSASRLGHALGLVQG